MCGIIAYIGYREAYPILIRGLHRLEYRGYDSAGVAVMNIHRMDIFKKNGKVQVLEHFVKGQNMPMATMGMGHTRWATHGTPCDKNAHPHTSDDGKLAIIHNGIIENYASIKEELLALGHLFKSETDTEVLIHLIASIQKNTHCNLYGAVRAALDKVVGTYAMVIMSEDESDQLIVAKKDSPLIIGVGQGEYFVASDATPIVEYTNQVTYLKDNEIAFISRDKWSIKNSNGVVQVPDIETIALQLEMLEKNGYEHFMLKEIYEQPRAVKDCLYGRIILKTGKVHILELEAYIEKIKNAGRIIIVACGTSWHAGLIGKYLIEEHARISVEVAYASEFRYSNPIVTDKDLVIAISQSGETADTIAAVALAKEKRATVFSICNVIGASIPRMAHANIYTYAGPEIGVASTKAFTAQVTVLSLIAFYIAQHRETMISSKLLMCLNELDAIPKLLEKTLAVEQAIQTIAAKFKNFSNCLFLGRGNAFPVALEGALKLKEVSYVHAEGCHAAEMKHGTIALVDEHMPVFFIATKHHISYDKTISNIQEIKARYGQIIAIISEDDTMIPKMVDYVIEVPHCMDVFAPLIAVIPLQLFAYHIAVMRGCNVDQPRNLAKSVTVE